MQNDESAVVSLERIKRFSGGVEGVRVDALTKQRIQHAFATLQRHLALTGGAAHQHCDFSKTLVHKGSPSRVSLPGTAPMLPAPIVITTSPS
jgi:hypothetical protein